MVAILPKRAVTRQRVLFGSFLVALTSLLSVGAFNVGPFGAPWPLAILWAICGWVSFGPNSMTAVLMLILGLWIDVLSGTRLGSWAFVALASFAFALLAQHFVGLGNYQSLFKAAICGAIMLVVIIGFELGQRQRLEIFGAILPIFTATLLYPFVARWFDLSEDEA
jgi:cell shape-determining protein MreD